MHDHLVPHLLDASADRHPDAPAIRDGDRTLSYAALAGASARLASVLRGLGVVPGDRVGILAPKSAEGVTAIYGVLKAGGIYVPLDPHAPASRNAGILGRCDATALVATGALASALAAEPAASSLRAAVLVGDAAPALPWATAGWADVASAPPAAPFEGSDTRPAYILHTSGSTGVPKGVTLSHGNALAFVRMAAEHFAIGPADRLAAHAPFHFDLSVFDLFVAARAGAAAVLVPEVLGPFPAQLAALLERERVTVWNAVASLLALVAERGALETRRLDALRLVLFSGDTLAVKHLRRARAHMPRATFYNVYGQTEANSSTCYRVGEVPDDPAWKIPIGRPFPNFDVFALDDDGRPISRPGEIGELHVCGATVALGYWGDAARTDAVFVRSPVAPWSSRAYRTGDRVTLDARGDLVFVGRRDRQVKSRGYRIQIDEIDLVLNEHPAVREAVVVDVPDELVGARIRAFVRRAAPVEVLDLLDFCGRALPRYMVPEEVRFLDEFPRTSTGKVDRNALRALPMA